MSGVVEIAEQAAAIGPHRLLRRVDTNAAHARKVDHQPIVAGAEAAAVVPAAAYGIGVRSFKERHAAAIDARVLVAAGAVPLGGIGSQAFPAHTETLSTKQFGSVLSSYIIKETGKIEHRLFRSLRAHTRVLFALLALLVAASAAVVSLGSAGYAAGPAVANAQSDGPGAAQGLGQLSGLLPRDHLTLESAIQVDLSKETVRLPLYKGTANGQTVWFVLLDASDEGLARSLGINFAPKLANLAIGCAACVQTVTLAAPTPAQNPFGQAVVNFEGAPDFSPTRVATPGPNGFPLAEIQPGAVAGAGYSPFIRIAGSPVLTPTGTRQEVTCQSRPDWA